MCLHTMSSLPTPVAGALGDVELQPFVTPEPQVSDTSISVHIYK